MSLFSEEQFNQIWKQLKKLDLLEVIAEDLKSINPILFENGEKIQHEKAAVEVKYEDKNNEHVRENNESLVQRDDKSVENVVESKSGEHEQNKIDQKATNVTVKFRRVNQRRRRKSASLNASLKVIKVSSCKVYLMKLQSAPSRVFMRKKKYKWDDGG
jgi:hypothetical protein